MNDRIERERWIKRICELNNDAYDKGFKDALATIRKRVEELPIFKNVNDWVLRSAVLEILKEDRKSVV